jgi:hypothetical protein
VRVPEGRTLGPCGTIRCELLKTGALVTVSARRIKRAMASGCPYKAVFATAIGRPPPPIPAAPSPPTCPPNTNRTSPRCFPAANRRLQITV